VSVSLVSLFVIFYLQNLYRINLTVGIFWKSIAFDARFMQNMDPLLDQSGRKLNSTDIDSYVGSQPLSNSDIAGFHKFYRNYRSHCTFLGSIMTWSKFRTVVPLMFVSTVQNVVAPVLCTVDISLSITVVQSLDSRRYMKIVKSMLCRQTVYDYYFHIFTVHF